MNKPPTSIGAGVWSATFGRPDKLTPLSAAGATPRLDALKAMGDAPLPFDWEAVVVERVGAKLIVRLPLEPNEALMGLGLQFQRMNHRGHTRYLRVNSDPKEDTGETHAPVPFYVSTRGYGVLANTARIPTFYCASTVQAAAKRPPTLRDRGRDPQWEATPRSGMVEIVLVGEGLELLVFAGPTMLDAVRRYNLTCGGGALPPRWGLGFRQRVRADFNEEQVIAEAQEFRKRGYPCDVIGLEPGWQSRSYPCSYEWGKDRFPHPASFVERMSSQGFRVDLWEHPYVSPEAKVYADLKPLSGSHTVWGGLAPDYSLPKARKILAEQHDREHVSIGIAGYKLDECDGSELTGASWMFPGHATFPSGNDGERIRQVYGLLLQRLTEEIFRKHNRRTYGLVRASNAGASSLPYVLYSDLYDHRQFVRALCNCGFSGLLWTPEAREAANAEEWVRRMQVVCLSPMALLNAWSSGTKPWSFPEVAPIVLRAMQLRMRLMPYLYSAFARYHFDGTPPFRAVCLEPGTTDAEGHNVAVNVDDAYMMGDSLLVAPLFAGQKSREVLLPEGAWFDFETGRRFEGGRRIEVSPGLERQPIFAREGAIVPLMPPLQHAPHPGEAVPLEVRHYGAKPSRFLLYDDDGETFDYERGRFQWRSLEATVGADGKRAGSFAPSKDNFPTSYGDATWNFLG